MPGGVTRPVMSYSPTDGLPTLHALVPMVHVASVPRSIDFYARLGFSVRRSWTAPGESEPSWAWLEAGGASLMVVRGAPISAGQQGIVLTLYCDDVATFHAALERAGLAVAAA